VDSVAVTGNGRIRILGGAAFRAKIGTVSVTWPLASAVLDDWGVQVDIRARFLKKLLGPALTDGAAAAAVWGAQWATIDSLEAARRSVVLRAPGTPASSCRFAVVRPRALEALIASAGQHEVPVRRVRTTLGWYFGRAA